jgi:hypothetical protein
LVMVCFAIDPKDSPRRYIKYAATKPETTVANNITLFIELCDSIRFSFAIYAPLDTSFRIISEF